ncbi:MAG TPA: sialidase family protein [Candidatus Thermoplasmatota archaeon]|nr:sialidase family protein [Candidatus Thermoplasmatota archaeon]
MHPPTKQSATLAILLTLLAALAPLSQAQPGVHSAGTIRPVATGMAESLPSLAHGRSAPAAALPALPSAWTISAPDPDPNSGYEVAAYALDAATAIVVHKRFHDGGANNEYAPAELVALRTVDGGATWNETVLDGSAPERVRTVDGSLAVAGKGDDVYVVYHERDSGFFDSMRLLSAHSADRGLTWSLGTVVDGWAGDFAGLTVLDATTAVASYHGEGQSAGLWVAVTTDAGQSWQAQRVASGSGSGWYTSVGAADAAHLYVSHYDGASDRTDLNVASSSDGGQTWTAQTVAKQADHRSGLGSALASPAPQSAYVAFEDDGPAGPAVLLARTHDGALTWDTVAIEAGVGGIGWNLDLQALDADRLLVSYWAHDGQGQARVAASSDGGATWSLETVPESGDVAPYVDLAAADLASPFVAYQVFDQATGSHALRIAHRTATPPPPPPTPPAREVILRYAASLGALGSDTRTRLDVPLAHAYTGIQLTATCPASVGTVQFVAAANPAASLVSAACTLGRATASIPAGLPAGSYALAVAVAGSGEVAVEVTGVPA